MGFREDEIGQSASNPLRKDGSNLVKLTRIQIVLFALWFGVVAGLAELCVMAVHKMFFQRMFFLGPDFVWMTPLANLLLFLPPAFVFWLIVVRWPRLAPVHLVAFIFAFVGFLSLLVMYPRLYRPAQVLLAAGLAV